MTVRMMSGQLPVCKELTFSISQQTTLVHFSKNYIFGLQIK